MTEAKESWSLPVTIIGCGLSGAMVALLLAQSGEKARVLEAREDWRGAADTVGEAPFGHLMSASKRSYNLGVSYRGMAALEKAGLLDAVQEVSVTMRGRVLHRADGTLTMLPFAEGNYTLSVSRPKLSEILLDAMERQPNIELIFGARTSKVDSDGTVHMADGTSYPTNFLIAADGAHSKVRESMQRSIRMNYSIEYAQWGYKELHIPSVDGNFALADPGCLHLWPRDNALLLGLPNTDKTFSLVVIMPFTGPDSLETIVTPEQILEYFGRSFPDLLGLLPDVVQEWQLSPGSSYLALKCDPWLWNDRVILIGDAAHATYPFYGQGMNAAFDDCLILTELYQGTGRDVAETLRAFNAQRIQAGHDLCDLSMDNFIDMRVRFAHPLRMIKYVVDTTLHRIAPDLWVPLFDMISFTRIPYDVAWCRAKRQDKLLRTVLLALFMLLIYLPFYMLSNRASHHQK